jgi:hypothetical protein
LLNKGVDNITQDAIEHGGTHFDCKKVKQELGEMRETHDFEKFSKRSIRTCWKKHLVALQLLLKD